MSTTKSLNLQFEKAIRLLAQYFPVSDEKSRKPRLFHLVRVGTYLYEKNYPEHIVLAGVLHDAIEWSSITTEMLRTEFGNVVTDLVLANTQSKTITDKVEKTNELIERCARHGQNALIVKAADVIDSFKWYTNQDNKSELEYCMRNADAIFRYKPAEFEDEIFKELHTWQTRFANPPKVLE